MKVYALCGWEGDWAYVYLRFYKHKEDAKWAYNKMLADEDEEYFYEEYERYSIEEVDVIE